MQVLEVVHSEFTLLVYMFKKLIGFTIFKKFSTATLQSKYVIVDGEYLCQINIYVQRVGRYPIWTETSLEQQTYIYFSAETFTK